MNSSRVIDVRQYPEFAAAHIKGSELVPLQHLARHAEQWDRNASIMLVCKTGRRAAIAKETLRGMGFGQVEILDGGIVAWSAAGNETHRLEKQPWSMERQVRVVAGSLVLMTMALAWGVSKYFLAATAFVGAGLVFAGVSDICMMASLLAKLPWNRPAKPAPSA